MIIAYVLLIIVSNLIFYCLGRWYQKEEQIIEVAKSMIPKKEDHEPTQPGVLDYVTPEKSTYVGSEDERIDKAAEDLVAKMFGQKK